MATLPTDKTNNPVGSTAPVDMAYNSAALDCLINDEGTVPGRLGKTLITWDEAVSRLGYVVTSGYEFGQAFTIVDRNEVVLDILTGNFYIWTLALPKVMTGSELPTDAGWGLITDAALRGELASTSGASIIGSASGRTVQVRLDDIKSAEDFGIIPGNDVTAAMNALESEVSGKRVYFGPGVYIMSGVLWTSITNFELHFHPGCEFKVADGADTWAFRLSVCSNFNIIGRLKSNGNKANNTTGGSGPGASNGTIALSSCSDFEIESAFCADAHTMGIAFENCSNWKAGKLTSNASARVGVSIYLCTDFDIESVSGDGSDLSNILRMENNQRWTLGSSRTKNAGTVGSLIEIDNSEFTIGSLIDNDSFSGSKIEDCDHFSVGSMHGMNSNGSHCTILNNVTNYHVGAMIGSGAISGNGAAILAAGSPHENGNVDYILTYGNAEYGVQVQRSGAGQFSNVTIGSIISYNNTLSNLESDGGVLSGKVSVGKFRGGNPGAGRWDVEDATPLDPTLDRLNISDFDADGTSNYSNSPILSPNSTSPNAGQFLSYASVLDTANTVPTTITNLTNYIGVSRIFYIFVGDSNTTFANGGGGTEGRIIVQGSSVAANFGELWQVTYRNEIMYMHKVS